MTVPWRKKRIPYQQGRLAPLFIILALGACAAAAPPDEAAPPLLALDDYTPAIDAALTFLHAPHPSYHPFNFLFLDYLARKFDLGDAYRYENMYQFYKYKSAYEVLMLRLAFGLLMPDLVADPARIDQTFPGADRLLVQAVYCGRMAPPHDPGDAIREAMHVIGYDLIVAALAFQWALEQGCLAEDTDTETLRDALATRLVRMVEGEPDVTAAMLEGIALLFYLGEAQRIQPHWIQQVARARQEDGGWSVLGPDAMQPSEHYPTLRALWVLLEAQFPFVRRIPFARGPGDVPKSDVAIEAIYDAVALPASYGLVGDGQP